MHGAVLGSNPGDEIFIFLFSCCKNLTIQNGVTYIRRHFEIFEKLVLNDESKN